MTDKKLNRPAFPDPNWANDALLNDPGETWDGTPTKVEPGAGKRDIGWNPDEKPSAQHLSQLLHELGLWTQYLSDIQPQNWGLPIEIRDAASPTAEITSIEYDRASRLWWAGSNGTEALSSPDGYNWTDASPGAGNQAFKYLVSKRPSDAPVHATNPWFICGGNNGATNEIHWHKAGAWAFQTMAGVAGNVSTLDGVYDPSNQLWLAAGFDLTAGIHPTMYYAPAATMVFVAVNLPVVTSTQAKQIATNRSGLSVIVGNGTNADVWTSSDGINWVASAVIAEVVNGLAYDEERDLFVIVAETDTYTSPDGVAWTNVSDMSPGADFGELSTSSLICVGSLYLATVDGSPEIRFSTNGGVHWHQLYLPAAETTGYLGFAYSPHVGQFLALQFDVANNEGWVNRSLAVGTGNYLASGAEFTPQT